MSPKQQEKKLIIAKAKALAERKLAAIKAKQAADKAEAIDNTFVLKVAQEVGKIERKKIG